MLYELITNENFPLWLTVKNIGHGGFFLYIYLLIKKIFKNINEKSPFRVMQRPLDSGNI